MLPEEAMEKLTDAISSLVSAGHVVTGELSFCKPKVKLTSTVLFTCLEPVPLLQCTAAKITKPENGHTEEIVYTAKRDTGEICSKCGGANLRWAGACKVCSDCGESGGCG